LPFSGVSYRLKQWLSNNFLGELFSCPVKTAKGNLVAPADLNLRQERSEGEGADQLSDEFGRELASGKKLLHPLTLARPSEGDRDLAETVFQ
jgi:hypothetical protein